MRETTLLLIDDAVTSLYDIVWYATVKATIELSFFREIELNSSYSSKCFLDQKRIGEALTVFNCKAQAAFLCNLFYLLVT